MGTKHGVTAIRTALDAVVAEQPERVDRRASTGELAPRYVEHGAPGCLVAAVLYRMDISLGLLKQLDREMKGPGGVLLWASSHAIRRRFTPAGWALLGALQACNDQGSTWQRARERVFQADAWIGRTWKRSGVVGRPWLHED